MTDSNIVSVALSAEVREALETEAKRQRRSRSWIVREAVAEYVARQQERAAELDAFERERQPRSPSTPCS